MRLGWGHDDGAFFFSRPDAAQQECCEPGFTLLCMGLFSRFFVQALPCTAEATVCRGVGAAAYLASAIATTGAQAGAKDESAAEWLISVAAEAAAHRGGLDCFRTGART